MLTDLEISIDYDLLREQKRSLCTLLDDLDDHFIGGEPSEIVVEQKNALEGILSLLDCIQDAAAEQHGEEKIFGRSVLEEQE